MPTPYLVYDVFTDSRFGGNQLAIFPDARALPEAGLAAIAREFNFSEVVYLYPPEDLAHTARVRIFSPEGELPFAGHPTIGTAAMLAEAGLGPEMVLELGIGPLAARFEDGRASFTTEVALGRLGEADPALIARALGLEPGALAGPVEIASLGLPFAFAELTSRAALAACRPEISAFRTLAAAHPEAGGFHIYAWVAEGETLHARMFAPLIGISEDPATGSAAAALAALLCARRGAPVRVELHQGDDMGRPSRIGLAAEPGRVTVSGRAVRVMQGELL